MAARSRAGSAVATERHARTKNGPEVGAISFCGSTSLLIGHPAGTFEQIHIADIAEAIAQLMRLKPTSCSSIATAGLDAVANKSRLMGKFCGYNCVMGVATVFDRELSLEAMWHAYRASDSWLRTALQSTQVLYAT
jgi:hypothetical protein